MAITGAIAAWAIPTMTARSGLRYPMAVPPLVFVDGLEYTAASSSRFHVKRLWIT
jgi:hypothetical protein